MKRFLLLGTVVAGSVLAASAPAHAYVYSLNDEYWLKAGTAFSTVFAGATGNALTQGIYQETGTGATPTIVQLSTTNFITTGSANHFYNAPVTGEFTQNDGGSAVVFSTWQSTSFKTAGNSAGGGPVSAFQINTVVSNPAASIQYLEGASVNAATGAFSGTAAAFNLNSIDLSTSVGTATGYVVEGLLGGVVEYSEQICTNGNQYAVAPVNGTCGAYNQTATVPFSWSDIDTFEFGFINQGTGQFQTGWPANSTLVMDNINITPYVPSVPEPASLALLGLGMTAIGIVRRKTT